MTIFMISDPVFESQFVFHAADELPSPPAFAADTKTYASRLSLKDADGLYTSNAPAALFLYLVR